MARVRNITHICENCQKPIKIAQTEYFNNCQDKDKLPMLREYALFNNFCPYCGNKTYPETCLLYQDVDNRVIIYYIDGQNAAAKKEEVLKKIAKEPLAGYSYRVVTNRVEFVQKVEMLLCGYDDRILELAKWLTFYTTLEVEDQELEKVWFELDEEENAVWHIDFQDDKQCTMEITPELYAEFVVMFNDIVETSPEQICMDAEWASEIILRLMEEYERDTGGN